MNLYQEQSQELEFQIQEREQLRIRVADAREKAEQSVQLHRNLERKLIELNERISAGQPIEATVPSDFDTSH